VTTHLVATEMIAVVMEQVGDLLYIDGVVEGGSITYLTLVSRHFPLQTLDQMTNGHSTGDGVGVDYDVGVNTLGCERHVLQQRMGYFACIVMGGH